jgi:hypothetical protein
MAPSTNPIIEDPKPINAAPNPLAHDMMADQDQIELSPPKPQTTTRARPGSVSISGG